MKYAGNVIILDGEGNVLFEKDLSEDEIVETLLGALPDADEPEIAQDAEPETVPVVRQTPPAKPKPTPSGTAHSCCGSKGKRHKKDCQRYPVNDVRPTVPAIREAAEAPTQRAAIATLPNVPSTALAELLTEDEWEQVKDMREQDDRTSLYISNHIGADLQQVNYAILAADYDTYCRNASR